MSTTTRTINGIDTDALAAIAGAVAADPQQGKAHFQVATNWMGGTRSDSRITSWSLGGRRLAKDFTLRSDEPSELLGSNTAPNPQEMILSALNACMTVGYVAGCAMQGVTIRSLRVETDGELDLRGFLGLDPAVKPGFATLRTIVKIDADATPEQLREIHENVLRTSPNRWNLGQPIQLQAELVIG